MGGWKLEVFKAGVYLAFPVAVFYYFHQPEYFEKWLVKIKQESYPPDNPIVRQQLQDLAKQFQEKQEKEMIKAMEEASKIKT